MAKTTAWLVTLIGVILVLVAAGFASLSDMWVMWVIALSTLVIGVTKLMRNYGSKKR